MPTEGEAHEHVCSVCLKTYRCTDPADADLEIGLCPKHKKSSKKRAEKRAKK
jgi:hypothetical protein